MRKNIFISLALFICTLAYGQVDSTYVGLDIFEIMPSESNGTAGTVTINQPSEVKAAVQYRTASETLGQIPGYRIRIFSSNAQEARNASLAAVERFEENYPGYGAYRTYVLPNFKVTVGDFRTKSEALMLLEEVKKDFPSSFVVKENINLCD